MSGFMIRNIACRSVDKLNLTLYHSALFTTFIPSHSSDAEEPSHHHIQIPSETQRVYGDKSDRADHRTNRSFLRLAVCEF